MKRLSNVEGEREKNLATCTKFLFREKNEDRYAGLGRKADTR